MTKTRKSSVVAILAMAIALVLVGPSAALAATSPTLGMANSFVILSNVYTNTVGGDYS